MNKVVVYGGPGSKKECIAFMKFLREYGYAGYDNHETERTYHNYTGFSLDTDAKQITTVWVIKLAHEPDVMISIQEGYDLIKRLHGNQEPEESKQPKIPTKNLMLFLS